MSVFRKLSNMKQLTQKSIPIVLALFLLVFSGCNRKIRNEEELAERLLYALRDLKLKDFCNTFLSKKDFQELTVQMRKIPGLEDADEDALLQSWDEYQLLISEMFRSIIDEGVQTGIHWSHIEILSVVPGDEAIADYIPPAVKMLDDLSIRFKEGKSTYLIRFYDPVRLQDSWKISSHLYLLHKEG